MSPDPDLSAAPSGTADLEAAKRTVLSFHTWVSARLEDLIVIQERFASGPVEQQRAVRCELGQCRTEIARLKSLEAATSQYLIALQKDFIADKARPRHSILSDFDDN